MREVVVKEVGQVHVLAVRRTVAGQRDVVEAIATLRPSVADVLAGPPMGLVLGFPKDGKLPVEIAFPTRAPISREGFATKTLPALRMFTITHAGPLEGGPEGETFQDTQRKLSSFLRDRKLLPGDDPERFLYHEGAETHGDRTDRYVTEVQYPDHLPIWLDALEAGTERAAGKAAAARVMAGSEDLVSAHEGERTAAWVHGAIGRLDREVEGEEGRASILNACAHRYIVQSADVLRQAWKETPDLRTLVRRITDEALLGSRYWIDESGPEPLLLIERRPARAEAYAKATDPAEKRYQACFCPLVRDAIRAGKKVSRTFCHCSGGWYVQEWEVVFGKRPRVDLVRTMLEGADSCVFAVHIPEGFLQTASSTAGRAARRRSARGSRKAVPMQRPRLLKKGDVVGIVSTSSPVTPEAVDEMRRYFEERGYRVKLAPNVLARFGFLAGSAEVRANDLNLLLRDPDVRMIVTASGGAGAAHLLPLADYDALAADPKIVAGLSNPSVLLNAMTARTGVPTFHGPNGVEFGGLAPLTEFTETNFWPLVRDDLRLPHAFPVSEGMRIVRPGPAAEGPLFGGDLRGVQLLIGTPWEPEWEGAVLFVELYEVELFRLDAFLSHLRLAGVFAGLRALLVGRPVECDAVDVETLDDIVLRSCEGYGFPIVTDVPIGHTDDKITVPLGCRVRLDPSRRSLELLESPTR